MNHAVAQRLTRFAEDVARTERKVDEVLALLRPLTTPAGRITTPGEAREATADEVGQAVRVMVATCLRAYGHTMRREDSVENAILTALDVERSRRTEAINDARVERQLRVNAEGKVAQLLAAIPGASIDGGGIVMPGSPERRRWSRRRRR